MMTIPNFLSFLRIPLAFVFLSSSVPLRCLALLGAMLTDFLDGFLARRYHITSRFGTTLDPIADKFFVVFALTLFFQEGKIGGWEALSMLSRDFALAIFGGYLVLSNNWQGYQFRAIWSGKIATALQLMTLVVLTLNYPISDKFFVIFMWLGVFALGELWFQFLQARAGYLK